MEVARPREEGPETIVNRTSCFQVSDGVPILNFDFSLENFFSTMETISALCGETKEEIFEASEIERFNSMIVFVREWKQFYFCEWMPFYYKSKIVNFSYQTESAEAKNDINGINLPHLSSGAVPKVEKLHRKSSQFDNDDFVLHVGGSVWALDWCPRLHENIGYDVKCEYLAIAAHPNGSEYHKIGEQLSGRGFIQIWCFLHLDDKEELLKPKGMRRKGEGNKKVNEDSYVPKRKGRPRKTLDDKEELLKPEGMRRKGEGNKKVTEDSCVPKRRGRPRKTLDDKEELLKTEGMRRKGEGNKKVNEDSCVPKRRRRPRKTLDDKEELLKPEGTRRKGEGNKKVNEDSCVPKRRGRPRKTLSRSGSISVGCHKEELQEDINSASDLNGRGKTFLCSGKPIHDVCSQFHLDDCRETVAVTENSVHDQSVIPEGITLPRLMLSLAHNGKVAWDVKWRPFDALDSKAKHHLGYLAILLGNGSLEVWEVPTHNLVKILYANCQIEDTDPRFLKLQPVFRCSRMNFGERQSIPLTLEWSPSASRDLILAGCHDGTVALWKFCSQLPSKDTKPLLCFTADTVPIRSLAWAPDDSDAECSNLIVTGGHEGLKFWDLRSPYRPLLDLCPVQKAVLSLDWLKDPRCLVIAYEDGIVRTLSLTKMADDMLATGEASARTKQQGLHSQLCSIFTIWSVQVSRSTGLVAYCSSDGCTRYFQLTSESVNKDRSRYRMPHLLCGSLTEEGPTLSINTPLKAICWHDNHGTNNNSSHKKRKGNPSKEAEAGEKGALHGIDKMGDESKQNIQRFPPKIVAMHKLRWNLNKGSERWLCYGGAAGIVRCQIISPI